MTLEGISAVTLTVKDMRRSVDFYAALGFDVVYGGRDGAFTTFPVGNGFLNLDRDAGYAGAGPWGRAILYVSDVDAMYERAVAAGLRPQARPRDAEWGERYFHIQDPDGHEISFARPLRQD